VKSILKWVKYGVARSINGSDKKCNILCGFFKRHYTIQ